jgi:CHAT domain-containing protein
LPLLAIGDVRYKDSEMLAASTSSAEDKDADDLDSGRVRGVFDLEGARFTELPSTAEEVASVAEVAGAESVLLVAEGATEAALKAKPLDRFQVLHLAVHGIADAEFPHRAALVLGANLESGQDGLLQVREIITLSLAAELVTLSACDTAAGRLEGQEGITNLVTAFLVAGARTVVASLWAADDVFTTSLMRRFYGQLAAGEDRGSALRTAKLEMIERFGDQAVPFYWAGFTMVGDSSRPIKWTSGSKDQ